MSGFMNSLKQVVEKTRPRDQILGTVVKIMTGNMVSVYLTDGTQITTKCPYDVAEGDQVICTRPVGSPAWMVIGRSAQANMSPTQHADNNEVVIIREPIKLETYSDDTFIVFQWSIWPDYVGGFEVEVSYQEDHADANTYMLTSGTVCVIKNHAEAWLRVRTVTHSFVRGQWIAWLHGVRQEHIRFLDLYDVPHSYAGHKNKFVGVNGLETGLTFIDQFIFDPTNIGLILNVQNYPSVLDGQWVGLALDTVDSHAFMGMKGSWSSDNLWVGQIYHAADTVEAVLMFGDNYNTDTLGIYFVGMDGIMVKLGTITPAGLLSMTNTVAAGDYVPGSISERAARIGLMSAFAEGAYSAVGLHSSWAETVAALVVADMLTHKDAILAIRQGQAADSFRIAYIIETGGLDDVLEIQRDGTIIPKAGATFDGVDVSAHAADVSAHHSRYTDAEALVQAEAAVAAHTALVNPHATGFTDLLDAPVDYTGAGGKLVAVTEAEDGVEFVDGQGISILEWWGW